MAAAGAPNSPSAIAAANAGNPSAAIAPAPGAAVDPDADPAKQLVKGMRQQDVQTLLGAPMRESDTDHDGITVHSEVFERKDASVMADFMNGLLLKYTVSVH